MAKPQRRVAMDIFVPPPAPEKPPKKRTLWTELLQFLSKLPRTNAPSSRAFYTLGVIAAAAVIVAAVHWLTAPPKVTVGNTSIFPVTIAQRIKGFRFYYLRPSFQTDFVLDPRTISYQSGVLLFEMKSPNGKTLAFTEEATPQGYNTSVLRADKQYNNEYGQAFVTDAYNRTTGALFTADHTWVLVNAPQPIGSDLMQQILDGLVPAQSH